MRLRSTVTYSAWSSPVGFPATFRMRHAAILQKRSRISPRGCAPCIKCCAIRAAFSIVSKRLGSSSAEGALSYGLVGPIARASGVARDIRKLFPYAAYGSANFVTPVEQEGDGYARLRVFFHEAEQSAALMRHFLFSMPQGSVSAGHAQWRAGAALGAVEAPQGAAFHWLRLHEDGTVMRYRITPPSFANWHGFHLAAENFAFQDFPIILASFGLSNAECDR